MHKYPDFFMTHRIKRMLSNSKGDGMKFYYYDDDDHVVVNSGQPVIAFSEELPDDEFIMSDHKSIIAWKYANAKLEPEAKLSRRYKHFKELSREEANKYRMDILIHDDRGYFDTNIPQCMIIRSKNPMHKICYISNKTIHEILAQ